MKIMMISNYTLSVRAFISTEPVIYGDRRFPSRGTGCSQGREQAIPREGNRLFPGKGTGCSRRREQAIPGVGNRLLPEKVTGCYQGREQAVTREGNRLLPEKVTGCYRRRIASARHAPGRVQHIYYLLTTNY
jgi:hypothetical protein